MRAASLPVRIGVLLAVILYGLVLRHVFSYQDAAPGDWRLTGSFAPNGQFGGGVDNVPKTLASMNGFRLFGSHSGSDANTGEALSPPVTIGPDTRILVAGFPDRPGISLTFLDESAGQAIPIPAPPAPNTRWTPVNLHAIPDLVGRTGRIKAVDAATDFQGWIGISAPYAQGAPGLSKLFDAAFVPLLILPLAGMTLGLLILPTLVPAERLARGLGLPSSFVPGLALAMTLTAAYLLFWLAFFRPDGVWPASLAWIALALGAAGVPRAWRETAIILSDPDVRAQLMLILGAVVLLLALFFIDQPALRGVTEAFPEGRFTWRLPSDHILPKLLARHVLRGDPSPWLVGDWLVSDRPPLQAAAYLLLLPLDKFTGGQPCAYMVVAALLQTVWLPGAYLVLKVLGLNRRDLALIILLTILSGFVFVNTVFPWPKLLAAGLALIALAMSWRPSDLDRLAQSAVFGGLLGLAFLAHGGVVFAFPAIFLAFVLARGPSVRRLLTAGSAALAAFGLLYLPWSLYQRFVAPPGNRLIKWHLAGVVPLDDRSILQTLHDAYSALSAQEIVNQKLHNLAQIFGALHVPLLSPADAVQGAEFFNVVRALGLLAPGLLLLPALSWPRPGAADPDRRRLPRLILIVVVSLFLWAMAIFSEAIVHQGSYATQLLLFLLAALPAILLPDWTRGLIVGVAMVIFLEHWVLPPASAGPLNPSALLTALAAGLFLLRTAFVSEQPTPPRDCA